MGIFYPGTLTSEVSGREIKGREVSRKAAAEGIVLLEALAARAKDIDAVMKITSRNAMAKTMNISPMNSFSASARE